MLSREYRQGLLILTAQAYEAFSRFTFSQEDDPDYKQLSFMAAFIVLPIMAYAIVRLLFALAGDQRAPHDRRGSV